MRRLKDPNMKGYQERYPLRSHSAAGIPVSLEKEYRESREEYQAQNEQILAEWNAKQTQELQQSHHEKMSKNELLKNIQNDIATARNSKNKKSPSRIIDFDKIRKKFHLPLRNQSGTILMFFKQISKQCS